MGKVPVLYGPTVVEVRIEDLLTEERSRSALYEPLCLHGGSVRFLLFKKGIHMQIDGQFNRAYQQLEERMRDRALADGDIFLPNPAPGAPVQYILICMEPSLGAWADSEEEARAKVDAGFKNFLSSVEGFILHFCARRYLCGPTQRYHITDLSKGAMLVERAQASRDERYERWFSLLEEEITLVGAPGVHLIAVGKAVSDFLNRKQLNRPVTRVLHYSGQAARAREAGIAGMEDSFEAFRPTVSIEDVISAAEDIFRAVRVPAAFRNEALGRLARGELTESRKKLVFNYKVAFELISSARPSF